MKRIYGTADDGELERTGVTRQAMEVLLMRAQLLGCDDRALITAFLVGEVSLYQLGRLSGSSTSTIARRVRRIIRRLADETYSLCRKNRRRFNEQELEIIRDHFVRGLSMRRISEDRRLCYYRVCVTVKKARRVARPVKVAGQGGDYCI